MLTVLLACLLASPITQFRDLLNLPAANLPAGAPVRVTPRAGDARPGVLVAGSADSFRVAVANGDTLAFSREGIAALERLTAPGGMAAHVLGDATIGLLAGLALAGLVHVVTGDRSWPVAESAPFLLFGVPLGTAGGAALGASHAREHWQAISPLRSTLAGAPPGGEGASGSAP